MSQIATAYTVPADALASLAALIDAGDERGVAETLRRHQAGDPFEYSGYVVVLFVEYLRDRGIAMPVSNAPEVEALVAAFDPLVCAGTAPALAAADAIARAAPGDSDLAEFWRQFTGDREPAAATVLRAAAQWVQRSLRAGGADDLRIILSG